MRSFLTSRFLRYVLLADAATCAATGLLMTLGGSVLGGLLGLPAALTFCAGLSLFPFAMLLVYVATRETFAPRAIWLIIVLNALWTIDSFALLFSGWVSPTSLGYAFVTFQACGVAMFALLEFIGLRQATRAMPAGSGVVALLIVVFTLGLSGEVRAQRVDNFSMAPGVSPAADLGVRGIEKLVDRYFESLNEPDDKRRRALNDEVWAERGKFGTPYAEVEGRDRINELIAGVQRQFPNAIVRRTSKIDGFGKYLRWTFTLSDAAGKPILSGVDFAIVIDGKLDLVMGFFDFAPPKPQ